MKVLVGLGNPGARYEKTRHNLGYRVLDRLAAEVGARPCPESGGESELATARIGTAAGDEEVLLVKPLTWMNLSGRAVAALAAGPFGAPAPADTLVVVDDVYLPFGRLRLRARGSDGGHKGLKSILEAMGTDEVPRLRCGVGPLPEAADRVEFVLEEFSGEEARALPEFVDLAVQAVRCYLDQGLAPAMNRFNRK